MQKLWAPVLPLLNTHRLSDIVQEALSKKKEKKLQLSQEQKAISRANSDKREALQKYKSVNPIELPCETHQVCGKSFFS